MLRSIQIKNFKAIADSGKVELTPLTVFVGHNGSGKSSILEALEFFQRYALHGLDEAVGPWYDIDHILWQGHDRTQPYATALFYPHPLEMAITGRTDLTWNAKMRLGRLAVDAYGQKARSVAQKWESFAVSRRFSRIRQPDGKMREQKVGGHWIELPFPLNPDESLFKLDKTHGADRWMFLSLDPLSIGQPRVRRGGGHDIRLNRTGENLPTFLLSFLEKDPDGFNSMIESLRYILPYVADLRPEVVRDIVESRTLLRLTEGFANGSHAHLPGWVLSGGTLRLLAILAALRHPDAPQVLCIDELENGLDPRAIGFLVDEIHYAIKEEGRQVLATTHSPYLLDKLSLEHIVTVERENGGPPVFRRPAKDEHLKQWGERFAPGSLYTMGLYRHREGEGK